MQVCFAVTHERKMFDNRCNNKQVRSSLGVIFNLHHGKVRYST